jgi:toxin-antitoxin system PIN domain toxin
MYLADSSLWLALALSRHSHHGVAAQWFDSVRDTEQVAFCRATQQGLLRLLTHSTILGGYGNPPMTNRQAWKTYDEFAADSRVTLLRSEPPGVDGRWREYSERSTVSPKLWMDAYLAAFAVCGGHELVTTDHAFHQYRGLSHLVLR